MPDVHLESSWRDALAPEFQKPYWQELRAKVHTAYQQSTVYPLPRDIFAALDHCPLPTVAVVILGQDPYHGPGQAHGFCFSVCPPTPPPPSVQNIYKEIRRDIGHLYDDSGDLRHWAKQGVLLLNTTLTVEAGQPMSHQGWGWETFTNAVLAHVNEQCDHVAFLLWGKHAQSKLPMLDDTRHLLLSAPHPSPLSAYRGFLGCRHFSQTNTFLRDHNKPPIIW